MLDLLLGSPPGFDDQGYAIGGRGVTQEIDGVVKRAAVEQDTLETIAETGQSRGFLLWLTGEWRAEDRRQRARLPFRDVRTGEAEATQIAIKDDNAPAGAGEFRSEPTHGVSNTRAAAGTGKCDHAAAGIAEKPGGQFGVSATARNGGQGGEGRSTGGEEIYLRRCFFQNRCVYAHFVLSLVWI
jgi:hypothetical protein